jgi:hypothetical protein
MLRLNNIERRTGLSRESFWEEHLKPLKPVVFTDFMDSWPAKEKWTIDFFKKEYGHLVVPVYSANSSNPGKKYMVADRYIFFKEYLEILEKEPTDLRMFLYNIFRHAPELCNDYRKPTIMDGFIDSFPYLFFGGKNSSVALHYDIDLSHVFLSQFHGRKRVVLFEPQQSRNIYQHPFTVASYIDVNNPDYDQFPALKNVNGYECILNPGETLFMPSGYWHFIEYLDWGFSISLRSNESYFRRAKGLINITRHYVVDRSMNRLMGTNWRRIKADLAKKRAKEDLLV